MPFKLLSFIIILVVLVTFIGLNLGNTSDVNLWFTEKGQFQDVPIVISFFIVYIIGALSVVPYIIGNQFRTLRKKRSEKKDPSPKKNDGKKTVEDSDADDKEKKQP